MKYNSIVISGSPGVGKGALGKAIAKKYEWNFYSIGDIWRERWKKLYPSTDIYFEDYWKNANLEEQRVVNDEARKIMSEGKVVGDFRYVICCKGLPTLFIFLKSDLNIRARRALELKKYPDKSLEKIKQLLTDREKDEINWGKKLFGEDYDYREPKYYHLILDSGKLTLEEELTIITSLIEID
ncbi:MAG: AAA family ATPase [Nanoarchaeota archaeon]|nr:AAA family ATPase [Nanoarchaeota archaeon]